MKSPKFIASVIGLVLALIVVYLLRPLGIFHGTVMSFYMHPILMYAFILGLIGFVMSMVGKEKGSYRYEPTGTGLGGMGLVVIAVCLFVFGIITQGAYNARALYSNNEYTDVKSLPEGGVVRIMPKSVADTIANNNFSSSTETLKNSHIVMGEDGLLHWTYEQAPNGFIRTLTESTNGAVGVDASRAQTDTTNYTGKFKYGPSMKFADGIRWKVYKSHYLSQVTEIFAIPTEDGKAIFAAPYVKYKGFLSKRPYFAGVMLFHPDGEVEDLTPDEAAKNKLLAGSGRMFPEQLARDIHDAYAFNGGIINKWFKHKNQTQIIDPDSDNSQPYLMPFSDGTLRWVTVAEPYGKAAAVKAIFLTDAVSGETEIWKVSENQSYAGPRRALDAAAGRSYQDIVFGSGRGKFKAVEPRPAFFDGRLHYLISIVPDRKTSVSKSVIVDADSNNVVAVFDHDNDREATEALLEAMETGKLPSEIETDKPLDPDATRLEQLQQLINENNESVKEQQQRSEQMQKLLDQLEDAQAAEQVSE